MKNDDFLLNDDIKLWNIYWFDRKWLSEREMLNKGEYRPCVVFWKNKKSILIIPLSSKQTDKEWNIKYSSSTRKKESNIHINNLKILDPRSLKYGVCKRIYNIKDSSCNSKISSKEKKKEINKKVKEYLDSFGF